MSDKFIDLYDCYIHSAEPRRVFLEKLVKAAGGVAAAAAILPWLEGTGAEAAMVSPGDKRIRAGDEKFPGATGEMTAYVARPGGAQGRLPTVVVIRNSPSGCDLLSAIFSFTASNWSETSRAVR